MSVQHAETIGMQPGRVGLSAQLICLMRHRECIMKAKLKSIFALAFGLIAVAACGTSAVPANNTKMTANAIEAGSDEVCVHERSDEWSSDEIMHWHGCTRCGGNYERMIGLPDAKLEHTPGPEATCTEDQVCTVCGRVLKEALGHDLTHYAGKAASCTEIGWNAYDTCSRCGFTTYEELPKQEHSWYDWMDMRTSCDESGIKMRFCRICGETEKEEVDVGTHIWGQAEITEQPTCTEKGEQQLKCISCGVTETSVLKESGHSAIKISAKDATCTNSGLTEGSVCSVCGEVLSAQEEIPALGHSYELTYHKEPENDLPGEQIYQCKSCGVTYEMLIEAQTLSDSSETNVWKAAAIMAGAAFLLGAAAFVILFCLWKRGKIKCRGGESS